MKTRNSPATRTTTEVWAPITRTARCFHCSIDIMHRWGRAGRFGYRQTGPRRFEVLLPEAIRFYTAKYPNISIDRETLDSLMQSTA